MNNQRKFKVIVRNSANKIEAMHCFDSYENALICLSEFIKYRYSHFHKISLEAIQC